MILTDREIRIALDCGQLEITPYPAEEAFSSTSVDLSLGEVGRIWKNTDGLTITPGEATYSYKKIVDTLSEQVQIQTFKLKQHSLLLAWTTEEIHLPNQSRIAARVEGKSSHARIGIGIHVI